MCCPSHRLEDGRWLEPTSIYHAPVAIKAEVPPDKAPGLAGVAPGQKGPPDDPGGHHVAILALPRTPSGMPRNARIKQKAPERLRTKGPPASVHGHPGLSRGNPGWLRHWWGPRWLLQRARKEACLPDRGRTVWKTAPTMQRVCSH